MSQALTPTALGKKCKHGSVVEAPVQVPDECSPAGCAGKLEGEEDVIRECDTFLEGKLQRQNNNSGTQ